MRARTAELLSHASRVATRPGFGRSGPSLLIVGNFVSAWKPYRGVCEDLAAQMTGCSSSVVTTSKRQWKAFRAVDMLATTWLRRADYAIAQVDVYSGRAFLWAEAVCRLLQWLKKPYVLTLHGGNLPLFASRHPDRVRRLLSSAAAVTVPSPYLLEGLRGFRKDLRLIPNPISVGRYPFRLRRSLQPRLIWLRSFHEIYDPALAPGVLAELSSDFPDATLTMVGPDKGDGSLERARSEAVRAGVANRVRFVGGVPKAEVPQWLCLGDIFLNTARVDNTPVSVLEAMACGLCVVSTNVGGIPNLLEHERDALLVPPGDVRQMSAAVRRLLADGQLAERISFAARRKAEERDWENVLPLWTSLLDSILSSRPAMSART
jgi:glycosyltransferase involved in cell wall biosynthesis